MNSAARSQQGALELVQKHAYRSQVLVRGRLHAVRGKGKSAFLVLRQGGTGATVQAVLFVDDKTVSKVRSRRSVAHLLDLSCKRAA
jgi:aspartyl/asparaginyl-tRNA synthetase